MIAEDSVYKIGTITRVHALRGEVGLSFTDDVWDRADAQYLVLRMDGILVPFFMEEYRFRSDSMALIKFVDIDDADQAQELVGADVYFPFELVPEDDPEDFRWSYFTGFRVLNGESELGTITHVEDSTSNVLFYIDHDGDELLVPAVEDFIRDIDHSTRTITMQLPDGLLDLNA